jgi:hypothetical protein
MVPRAMGRSRLLARSMVVKATRIWEMRRKALARPKMGGLGGSIAAAVEDMVGVLGEDVVVRVVGRGCAFVVQPLRVSIR